MTTTRNDDDFTVRTDPFRRELLTHCYRMLGSVQDAEDQVQETYLRAWRSYEEFAGRSSVRTWLYRIATNVCLTELERRGRRPALSGLPAPDDAGQPEPAAPDAPDGQPSADPASIVEAREHLRSALARAWQLPARQRAVLILRDVLSWPAAEVAEALGSTDTAVHSMLRRARAQIGDAASGTEQLTALQRDVIDRYAAAFEDGDLVSLVHLLTEEPTWRDPNSPIVVSGRTAVGRIMSLCPAFGECRVVPISVAGQAGIAVYRPGYDGVHRAYSIEMLDVTAAGIDQVEVHEDRMLFTTLGLPQVHDGSPRPRRTAVR